MSNFLAIATVTETLRQLLDATVRNAVAGASATAVRPATAAPGGQPNVGVNIFLYQVSPNAAWRNMDLPTRRDDASLMTRPRAALDLHYLLTFYGQDGQLEPQRVLGRVVQTMHAQPVLSREQIRNAISAVAFLAASNLADEVELVKFSPLPLTLEELSKLWSVFFQSTYVLSLAYQGTVVLIEGDESPQPVLPVLQRSVRVLPFQMPLIEDVSPSLCVPGDTLTIKGQNLRSDIVRIDFRSTRATPSVLTNKRIDVVLPPGLAAGVNTVSVVQFLNFNTGAPSEPHRLFESNLGVFVLAPTATILQPPPPPPPGSVTVVRGQTLTLGVTPPIGRSQDARLLLGSGTIALPARPTTDPPTADNLIFTIPPDFPTGEFLMRLQVDGAQSQLVSDPVQGYTGPKVTIIGNKNCLRSTMIAFNASPSGMNATASIQDETGAIVQGAQVSVTWTLPDGTTQDDRQQTNSAGAASFSIDGGSGQYLLTIVDITKVGSAFDQQQSTVSGTNKK